MVCGDCDGAWLWDVPVLNVLGNECSARCHENSHHCPSDGGKPWLNGFSGFECSPTVSKSYPTVWLFHEATRPCLPEHIPPVHASRSLGFFSLRMVNKSVPAAIFCALFDHDTDGLAYRVAYFKMVFLFWIFFSGGKRPNWQTNHNPSLNGLYDIFFLIAVICTRPSLRENYLNWTEGLFGWVLTMELCGLILTSRLIVSH